ncbi:MAG: type III-B CRISPR module-associated protein Cmr3 [Planctomycetota bacterium]|nr:type III-B CRISPR module-associated protein Cmr3 [Planctomycetota bacterium]
MTTTLGLQLEPLDVLFFRDGRPFTPASRGRSELPMPQTLAGALWTGLLEKHGCDFTVVRRLMSESKRDLADAIREASGITWLDSVAIRGPWLARRTNHEFQVLVPAPAVLHVAKHGGNSPPSTLVRLRPLAADRLPGWKLSLPADQVGLWPLWHRQIKATEPASGFLTPDGLRDFLADREVQAEDVKKPKELFDFDHRTGIGIDPDRLTAQDSLIYAASFLALAREVCLYAEVVLPDGVPRDVVEDLGTLRLGGEGRRVRVSALADAFSWSGVESASAQLLPHPLVLLTTPAMFAGGWRPQATAGRLLAASVPGSVPVSGWDLLVGGPKRTRFAVPPGSVYYLNKHLDPWPLALSDAPEDQRQGWGCYVKGVWNE